MRTFQRAILTLIIYIAAAMPAVAAASFADLTKYPQTPESYIISPDARVLPEDAQAAHAENFRQRFFAPWHNTDVSYLDTTLSDFTNYTKKLADKTGFLPGGAQASRAYLTKLIDNSLAQPFATPLRAIATDRADLRVLPTKSPLYPSKDSALGARGLLQMDILQNSTVKPGEPLLLFAPSRDGGWVLASTPTAIGWIEAASLGVAGDDFVDYWLSLPLTVSVPDNVKLPRKGGGTITAKTGTILPMIASGDNLPRLVLPTAQTAFNENLRFAEPVLITSGPTASERAFVIFPLPFTQSNAARVASRMVGERYGWGGSGGLRDCSATTLDYFSVFGVWLPRNSGDQAKMGAARFPVKSLPRAEKNRTILERGVPFATLLHMPGHIMLYVGAYNGAPVVMHNAWGVRVKLASGATGRKVLGKTACTSLRLGAELKDRPSGALLEDQISTVVIF